MSAMWKIGLCSWGVAAALEVNGTQSRKACPGPKFLSTADSVVLQLKYDLNYNCCGTGPDKEKATVGKDIYGLISGPLEITDGFMYPSDKAVAWLSNHEVVELWLNGDGTNGVCCNAGSWAQCLCKVADIAWISQPRGNYELVVVQDAKAISPRWTNTEFWGAFTQSYDWVFGKVTLASKWGSIEKLQQGCGPSAETWQALQRFNVPSPGEKAYDAIMADGTYGAQMRRMRCADAANGGCECIGRRGAGQLPYCHTSTDVALFCGAGGTQSCDPSEFLCPSSGLPVGYVRAYLYKFFDAISAFRGTGFSNEEDTAPEFIMRNTKTDSSGVRTTAPTDMTGRCG